ncbi:MAG: cupin domain-containing protein [Phycisphaerales bacterium]|nr:cupin domain-containing protein [Phycisphaerales bacterium]
MKEVMRKAAGSRKIAVVGDVYSILVAGEETGGAACVIEAVVPPGGGPPLHVHSREDELFYVLEGEITFHVEDGVVKAGPGTSVFAPRGRRHRFANESARPAKMLVTIMPAGLEKMFMEVSLPVVDGAAGAPTPEHMEAVMAACPRYGVTIVPPG